MKMKVWKRLVSFMLALVLVTAVLPESAVPASAANISASSSVIKKGDYIAFGKNGQKWRVLDASKTSMGSNGMFLVSQDALDTSAGVTSMDYATNDLKQWCTDYYNNTSNWNWGETDAILATTVAESTGTYGSGNFSGTNYALSGDKLFFLSAAEVSNSNYFADDNARKLNGGATTTSKCWHTRTSSPPEQYATQGYFVEVTHYGQLKRTKIIDGDTGTGYSYHPGFNLDTSKILFVTAAAGGKTSGLTAVDTSGNEWKLTLKDDSSFANGASINKTTFCIGESVTVNHKKLNSVNREYDHITAAIYSGSTMLYYGSVSTNTSATSTTFALPSDLGVGNYTLKLYGEQWHA